MILDTTFHLPEEHGLLKADGKGRVVGFLLQRSTELPRAIIIHLDHPGVTLEYNISLTPTFEEDRQVGNHRFFVPCLLTLHEFSVIPVEHLRSHRTPSSHP